MRQRSIRSSSSEKCWREAKFLLRFTKILYYLSLDFSYSSTLIANLLLLCTLAGIELWIFLSFVFHTFDFIFQAFLHSFFYYSDNHPFISTFFLFRFFVPFLFFLLFLSLSVFFHCPSTSLRQQTQCTEFFLIAVLHCHPQRNVIFSWASEMIFCKGVL